MHPENQFPQSPLMMMYPFMQQRGSDGNTNQVPARVRVALEFLNELSAKTARRPVANDMSIEIIDGMELNATEEIAQTAALRMLTSYFSGQLQPSTWEQYHLQQDKGHMLLLPCPGCNGEAEKVGGCTQCGGRGKVALARMA